MLFGLLLISEDSLDQNDSLTMFLGLPLQIKKVFYPLFIMTVLIILQLRIDILFVYLIGILLAITPSVNVCLNRLGTYF